MGGAPPGAGGAPGGGPPIGGGCCGRRGRHRGHLRLRRRELLVHQRRGDGVAHAGRRRGPCASGRPSAGVAGDSGHLGGFLLLVLRRPVEAAAAHCSAV